MSKQSQRRMKAKMIQAGSADNDSIILDGLVTIEAAAAGDARARRFTIMAYGGGALRISPYPLPIVVDLAGMSFRGKQLPVYYGHHDGSDGTRLLGHSDSHEKQGNKLIIAGAFSAATSYVNEILAANDNGYEWQSSIGARPDPGSIVEVPSGKDVSVNGQQFTGPILIARKSVLLHTAILPEGADATTKVSIAANAAQSKEFSMEFSQWVESMGLVLAELRDDQVAKLQAKYDVEAKAAAAKPIIEGKAATVTAPTFDLSACILAHQKHVASVEAKAAAYKGRITDAEMATIQANAATKAAELKSQALNEEWAAARFEVALIKAQADAEVELIRAERPKGPAIHASTRDMTAPVIEAAMCQTLGIPNTEKQYSDQVLQTAHTAFRGRVGLQQIILQAAAANGFACRAGDRIHNGNLHDVISYAFPSDIRAAHASTINLPSIFSNVANKELLSGFMDEDQTWREIAVTKNVSDFKSVTSYRMLDNMEYEELPPDGQIKHGHVGEETYTRQAKTYAKMFALTRTDIVNDDMGALDDLRTRLGRGAARKFNKVFWATFLNNSSFFTAGRGNYISGANTTLLTDYVGLALGITAFDNLKSTAVPPAKVGEKIGGTPMFLIVPPELEATALQIMAPIAATKASDVNIYSGRYRVLKVAQLSDSTFTGYSATAWYLLRDPRVLAAIVVSLLDGNANPVIESADASFDRLGVEFRGYHDFGCDQAEWLCGVKSKGAA